MLIGTSPPFLELLDMARRVARTDATVLLAGESGTGKDAVARAIHRLSHRSSGPFVPLDLSAIPENLLEGELFGHEVGAFSGAEHRRTGRLLEADGGTLYLEGLQALPVRAQARLLRALESREVIPLGSVRPLRPDFRVVAAAPPDLEERVRAGAFREDLYYRLKVVELRLPPLRERREDIQTLARAFARELSKVFRKPVREIAPEALEILEAYDWPGNVRELRNVIESAIASARGESITPSDLPVWLRVEVERRSSGEGSGPRGDAEAAAAGPGGDENPESERRPTFREQVESFQRRLLLEALGRNHWDYRRAGRELGLERHQVKYLCAKLDVRRPRSADRN